MAGPVVDTQSAQEFRREILDRITAAELQGIAAGLERKSRAMRDLLQPGTRPDRAALRQVLRLVFAARRRADQILDTVGPDRLGAAITDLLGPDDDLTARFDRFDAVLSGLPAPALDLPGELLHFTYPGQYWLWTRWIWDPATKTGALGLVTTEDTVVSLSGLAAGRRPPSWTRPGRRPGSPTLLPACSAPTCSWPPSTGSTCTRSCGCG